MRLKKVERDRELPRDELLEVELPPPRARRGISTRVIVGCASVGFAAGIGLALWRDTAPLDVTAVSEPVPPPVIEIPAAPPLPQAVAKAPDAAPAAPVPRPSNRRLRHPVHHQPAVAAPAAGAPPPEIRSRPAAAPARRRPDRAGAARRRSCRRRAARRRPCRRAARRCSRGSAGCTVGRSGGLGARALAVRTWTASSTGTRTAAGAARRPQGPELVGTRASRTGGRTARTAARHAGARAASRRSRLRSPCHRPHHPPPKLSRLNPRPWSSTPGAPRRDRRAWR